MVQTCFIKFLIQQFKPKGKMTTVKKIIFEKLNNGLICIITSILWYFFKFSFFFKILFDWYFFIFINITFIFKIIVTKSITNFYWCIITLFWFEKSSNISDYFLFGYFVFFIFSLKIFLTSTTMLFLIVLFSTFCKEID